MWSETMGYDMVRDRARHVHTFDAEHWNECRPDPILRRAAAGIDTKQEIGPAAEWAQGHNACSHTSWEFTNAGEATQKLRITAAVDIHRFFVRRFSQGGSELALLPRLALEPPAL